jgi:hypothetical protein
MVLQHNQTPHDAAENDLEPRRKASWFCLWSPAPAPARGTASDRGCIRARQGSSPSVRAVGRSAARRIGWRNAAIDSCPYRMPPALASGASQRAAESPRLAVVGVARDRKQPGPQIRISSQLRPALGEAQERVLQKIIGDLPATGQKAVPTLIAIVPAFVEQERNLRLCRPRKGLLGSVVDARYPQRQQLERARGGDLIVLDRRCVWNFCREA